MLNFSPSEISESFNLTPFQDPIQNFWIFRITLKLQKIYIIYYSGVIKKTELGHKAESGIPGSTVVVVVVEGGVGVGEQRDLTSAVGSIASIFPNILSRRNLSCVRQ